MTRHPDMPMIVDGSMPYATGPCPRGRSDCIAIARMASDPKFGNPSFICCGETDSAPVPTDRLRLCVKSSHDQGPVDVLMNFDERDATDTAYVLLGGLAAFQLDRLNAAASSQSAVNPPPTSNPPSNDN